ncbi:MAG: uroporphyrinogen decarboxylase family protein [Chlamydiota bacterium]
MEDDPGLIINLGHGIKPQTPLENVKWFVDCVKNFSKCSLRVLS